MDGNADMPQVEGATVSDANQSAYLEVATGCFGATVVDHSSPCTGIHERPCHVVRQLTTWNELLFPARMQLQEIPGALGQLALVSIDDDCLLLPEAPDFQMRQSTAYGFMHSLLKYHKCLASLHVTPFHFDKYTSPLCDALPHSCLKKLRLSCGLALPQGICAVIPSLTSLEELECSFFSDSCAEFPTALAALVRASPFLVSLRLSGISMEEQATKHLLTCLTERDILKDLSLERRVVPETCRSRTLPVLDVLYFTDVIEVRR
ncbi:hypothetical protein HPB52_018483 [Rhipicephalus sanguineus]|uniref:Uncharacterized protein n=1 Tax=Rhipicephalus sanguineus TaxID=34632 RepID=A0A9D4Q813_RHISA|nr:hypothetical protein HPB52_018483 [Rhipicephalus sanguineus]